jgi:2,3-bisphosphoglycerate-independent phosphoglycerate mutase
MSAAGIADALCRAMTAGEHDFFLCNFANADMVGHTGVLPAVIRAVETVDECLTQVLARAEATGPHVIITADHGNAELMIDPATGGVHTAHTTNPVPLVVATAGTGDPPLRAGGALCDVAPTVLGLMELPQPEQMTGRDLRLA